MDWTTRRDLYQTSMLIVVKVAENRNRTDEDVVTIDALVIDVDRDLADGPSFSIRVHAKRHRRARPEGGTQQVIRVRSVIVATEVRWLVAEKPMTADRHIVGIGAGAGLGNRDAWSMAHRS